jgi:SH3-like domain-containing protein
MDDTPRRVRVIEAHVPEYMEAIRFRAGEVLSVGHRDQQWTEYLWCTAQDGSQGWVPESYVGMTGRAEAEALRDYDGTELTVGRGDELEVLEEAGGWLRCRTRDGREGWVPEAEVEAA